MPNASRTINNKLPRTKSPRFCLPSLQERRKHHNSLSTINSEVCNRFYCIHPHFNKVGFSASDYKLKTENWKSPIKAQSLLFKISSSRLTSGFSLIDVLLTMFLMIMFTSILLVGSGSYLTSRKSTLRTIASKIASEQIDTLRKTDFSTLTVGTSTFSHTDLPKLPNGSGTKTISNYLGQPTIKLITTEVAWTEDTETKSAKMETLIYENGLK